MFICFNRIEAAKEKMYLGGSCAPSAVIVQWFVYRSNMFDDINKKLNRGKLFTIFRVYIMVYQTRRKLID